MLRGLAEAAVLFSIGTSTVTCMSYTIQEWPLRVTTCLLTCRTLSQAEQKPGLKLTYGRP